MGLLDNNKKGLFDDDDDELDMLLDSVQKYPSYVTELTEGIVQEVFNRCLATNDTPRENISFSILFSEIFGYKPEEQKVVGFDKNKLLDKEAIVRYLFGQLKSSHSMYSRMDFQRASYNYLGERWASNINSVAMLLYLAQPFELISPFFAETNETNLLTDIVIPTLSPKDQKFAPWWEIHKSEWEQSVKTGFKKNTPYTLGAYQREYFSATLLSDKKWNDDDDIVMI